MSAISFLLAALRITKPDGYLAYLVASLFPLLVSLLAFLLGNVLDSASVIMLYLLAVFLCALWLGKWPSVLAAVLSALMFNVLFVPPPLALNAANVGNPLMLMVLLVVAFMAGQMSAKLLDQNRALQESEALAQSLYLMARELAGAVDLKQVEEVAARYPFSSAAGSLLDIARERVHYADMAQTNLVQIESERLRSSILSSLSHDLRTPLTALVGLTDTLNSQNQNLSVMQQDMVEAIHEQSVRLAEMVTKLLDLARLSAGRLTLHKEWQPIDEVIGSALKLLEVSLAQRSIHVHIPADFPMLEFDAILMERVVGNLLENAAKYTPAGTPIDIYAERNISMAIISVCDRGAGFPSNVLLAPSLESVTQSGMLETPATGLGLAICDAILKAHDGKLTLEQRVGGGICARFTLPLGIPPIMEEEVDEEELL